MQKRFADVLEAVEELPSEEKEMLIDILRHRLRENKRQRIVESVEEARREFENGEIKPASIDEIMKEVLS